MPPPLQAVLTALHSLASHTQLWLAKVCQLHLCRFRSSQLRLTASSAELYAVSSTSFVKQLTIAVHCSTGTWDKVISTVEVGSFTYTLFGVNKTCSL